jgi:hypothetical protein
MTLLYNPFFSFNYDKQKTKQNNNNNNNNCLLRSQGLVIGIFIMNCRIHRQNEGATSIMHEG